MGSQAFKGKRLNGFKLDPNDLIIIGLDTSDGAEHPHYDAKIEQEVPETFILNVMALGVRDTIHIIKLPEHGDAGVVIAGRQRTRALREANKRLIAQGEPPYLIPCVLDKGEEADHIAVNVSTNEHRMTESPLSRARKAKKLLDRGMEPAEIAVYFGVERQAVSNWFKQLELGQPIRDAIEAGDVTPTAAMPLGDLPTDQQAGALQEALSAAKATSKARKKRGRRATTKGVQDAVDKAKGVKPKRLPTKRQIKELIERLEGSPYRGFVDGLRFVTDPSFDLSDMPEVAAAFTAGKD